MTIHWLLSEMKRNIAKGLRMMTIEQPRRMMFFTSVSVFVKCKASPKQPQSFTGFATTNHTVISVMMLMKTTINLEMSLRWMAKSRKMPIQNSTAASKTAIINSIQSGRKPGIPIAPR